MICPAKGEKPRWAAGGKDYAAKQQTKHTVATHSPSNHCKLLIFLCSVALGNFRQPFLSAVLTEEVEAAGSVVLLCWTYSYWHMSVGFSLSHRLASRALFFNLVLPKDILHGWGQSDWLIISDKFMTCSSFFVACSPCCADMQCAVLQSCTAQPLNWEVFAAHLFTVARTCGAGSVTAWVTKHRLYNLKGLGCCILQLRNNAYVLCLIVFMQWTVLLLSSTCPVLLADGHLVSQRLHLFQADVVVSLIRKLLIYMNTISSQLITSVHALV